MALHILALVGADGGPYVGIGLLLVAVGVALTYVAEHGRRAGV
jgi:hypothetical protein